MATSQVTGGNIFVETSTQYNEKTGEKGQTIITPNTGITFSGGGTFAQSAGVFGSLGNYLNQVQAQSPNLSLDAKFKAAKELQARDEGILRSQVGQSGATGSTTRSGIGLGSGSSNAQNPLVASTGLTGSAVGFANQPVGSIVERTVKDSRTVQDFRNAKSEKYVIGYKRTEAGGTEPIYGERVVPFEKTEEVEKNLFFYRSKGGELYALPSSVAGKKGVVEARLQAAERVAPLTGSSVGRVLLASGLGGGGNVALYREEVVKPKVVESIAKVSERSFPANPFVFVPQKVEEEKKVGIVLTPEQQARIIFAKGRTSLEPAFEKTAQQVRESNKDVPFVGDVGAAFVGLVGGAAKGVETVARSPITALKAVNEKITTGRVSKETALEAYGGLASASELLPSALVVNPEKAVAKQIEGKGLFESQVESVRPPEELKQSAITVLVGGLAGRSFVKSTEKLSAKPISVQQGAKVLVSEGVKTAKGETARGTFESKSIGRTVFGQEVRAESGGTFKAVVSEKGGVGTSQGIVKVGGEVVPVGSFSVSRQPAAGVFTSLEKSYLGIGEKGQVVGSVSKSRVLGVTTGKEFQGQLGGKLPVGGELETTRTVFVAKSKGSVGLPTKDSTFFVDTKGSVIDTTGKGLPSELYKPPVQPVSFPSSGVGVVLLKDRVGVQQLELRSGFLESVVPKAEAGIVGSKAFQLQKQTGKTISTASNVVSVPKASFEQSYFPLESKQVSKSYQVILPERSVVFQPETLQKQGKASVSVFDSGLQYAVREKNAVQSKQVQEVFSVQVPARKSVQEPLSVLRQVSPAKVSVQEKTVSFARGIPSPSRSFVTPELVETPKGGLGGGSPSGGFERYRGVGFKFKSPQVKQKTGLFPSLISITRQQQRTGRFGFIAPSKASIKKSQIFKRSGGEVVPVGEQLGEKSFSFKRFLFGKKRGQAAIFNVGTLLLLLLFFVYSLDVQLVANSFFTTYGSATALVIFSFFSFFLFASIWFSLVASRSGS